MIFFGGAQFEGFVFTIGVKRNCQSTRSVVKSWMNIFRTFLALLVCSVFAVAAVEVRAGSRGSTEGTFAGIEQGDYAHFLIKDKKGKDDSFIVLRPDKSVQPYLDNPSKLKGRAVRVHWKEQTIPEAGGKMKMMTKVESSK